MIKTLVILSLLSTLYSCTPLIHPAATPTTSCQLTNNAFITRDATSLPLKKWLPAQSKINSVIIALHGFNDYSHFFQQPGQYLSQQSIASYAYDQRGFGASPKRGLWAGIDTYVDDLKCFIQIIKNKYSKQPVFLLGESMGGAIVISTMAQTDLLPIDGLILVAPAVWARQTMPWYQNTLLWTLSHTLPWLTLTGEGLNIMPSDNIKMLKALSKDPLIIKETRVESIYGLVNLMDNALTNSINIKTDTLLLYGEKDDIIPKEPTAQFLKNLKSKGTIPHTLALYENGYHMLLRDLQAPVLWKDIESWIYSPSTPLPSGADKLADRLLIPQ